MFSATGFCSFRIMLSLRRRFLGGLDGRRRSLAVKLMRESRFQMPGDEERPKEKRKELLLEKDKQRASALTLRGRRRMGEEG